MSSFPALDVSAPQTKSFTQAPEMGIDPQKRYTATMQTTLGKIVIALDALKAPQTVNNFVFLSGYKYYDGIIFHRIIGGFMCQGGDPTGTGRGGPGYKFNDELPKAGQYQLGSIAMANAGPGTNGSQFFITVAETAWLNRKHTIFGEVKDAASQAVVDKIGATATGAQDKPVTPVVINSVTIA